MTTSLTIHSPTERTQRSRPVRAGSLFLSVLLAAGPGWAAKPKSKERSKDSPAPAAVQDDNEILARAALSAGLKSYNLGEFDDALKKYTEAYDLKPAPGLLFNIAQCHRQMGNLERASFFFKRYLTLSTKPPKNTQMVQDLIRDIDAEIAKKRQAEAALAAQTAKPPASVPMPPAPVPRKAQLEPVVRAPVTPVVPTAPVALSAPARLESDDSSVVGKWWFWAGLGVVAAAAGSTYYVMTTPAPSRSTNLGEINTR